MKFCTACGTRAEDASDRWCGVCGSAFAEAPAAPGPLAPYAPANQVASAPSPGWGVGPDIGDGPASTGAPAMLGREWPQDPDQAARRSRKKTPMVIGGALAGVIGVVGIGFGAVKLMSDPTGADSPEAAVRSVLDAISGQDPVAAVRVINPDEARGLDNAVSLTVDRVKKAGFDDGGKFTDAIDVQFENLSFDVDTMGDGAAKVVIDGRVNASFDPAELPEHMQNDAKLKADSLSSDLNDLLGGSPYTDRHQERTQVYLVTVERDGRWYVSPTATALELMTDTLDVPGGDFDAKTLASAEPSAETPDDAVTGLLRAMENQDLVEASGYLVSGQGDLVRAYEESFDTLIRQNGVDWAVEGSVRTASAISGGRGIVTISEATLTGTLSDESRYESGTLSVDGDCYDMGEAPQCVGGDLDEATGIDGFELVTVKEDGNWRIDLYGTATRYLDAAVRTVTQDAAAEAFDAPFLAEPVPLAMGEEVTLEFDRFGDDDLSRVLDVPVTAGKYVRVYATDGDVDMEPVVGLRAAEGSEGLLVLTAGKDGMMRVNVNPDGTRSATLRADLIDPESVKSIDPGDPIVPGELYRFTLSGSTDYEAPFSSGISACRLESGRCTSVNWDWSEGEFLIGAAHTGATAPDYSDYDY